MTNTVFRAQDRVKVLVPRPFDNAFDYLVPEGMQVVSGAYVQVPFGRNQLVGVVWGAGEDTLPAHKCKALLQHCEHVPPMPKALRGFIDWVADYTMAPRGMVLKMALPLPVALLQPPMQKLYQLASAEASMPSATRERVAEVLRERTQMSPALLADAAETSQSTLRQMVKDGQLIETHQVMAPPVQHFNITKRPDLSDDQEQAAALLAQQLEAGFAATLIDGVTGSGKTEVYFDTIEKALAAGGQVLVMLPEIALTVQWRARFAKRFGGEAMVWHSSVGEAERKHAWRAVASGSAKLVVGARSALFLPYNNLSLIVVDEEHEASYKQEDGVIYHARDMAVVRAAQEKIPIQLVSATPTLETIHNVQQGKYTRVHLPSRFAEASFPTVELIDMREAGLNATQWISPELGQALAKTFNAGHQAMLFLNRRGYAPLVLCRTCGHRFQCPRCSTWMVLHKGKSRLQCHHCDYQQMAPTACPECDSTDSLVPCGPGVERLAEEAADLFPQANIALLSSDQSQDTAEMIQQIIDKEYDLVIGTQLIAKGHHFPHLATVGVVDADLGLSGGDLRASERTYQLLHQIAGRAGREKVAGYVYLQTYQPEHPVMRAMQAGARDDFMALEAEQRELGGWPPYGRLAALLLDGPRESEVMRTAQMLVQHAPHDAAVHILGPAPAPLSKLRNQYRFRILVRTDRHIHLQKMLRQWLAAVKLPSAVRLKVDIDPYHFL